MILNSEVLSDFTNVTFHTYVILSSSLYLNLYHRYIFPRLIKVRLELSAFHLNFNIQTSRFMRLLSFAKIPVLLHHFNILFGTPLPMTSPGPSQIHPSLNPTLLGATFCSGIFHAWYSLSTSVFSRFLQTFLESVSRFLDPLCGILRLLHQF